MSDFHLIPQAMAADTATATVAASAPPATGFDNLMSFMPIILVMLVMYLFIFRPQQKQQQRHLQMLKALRRGDRVVTGGGIIGTVHKMDGDDIVVVEIADNVRVRVQRATITGLVKQSENTANSNVPDKSKSA